VTRTLSYAEGAPSSGFEGGSLRSLWSITKSIETWGQTKDMRLAAPNTTTDSFTSLYSVYIFCWHSSQYPPTSVRETVTFILKSRAICCLSCS
jgi:hypothetical protein